MSVNLDMSQAMLNSFTNMRMMIMQKTKLLGKKKPGSSSKKEAIPEK